MTNGVIELVALEGGGHIAEFRFSEGTHKPDTNVFVGVSLGRRSTRLRKKRGGLAAKYGPKGVGEFLASFTGHALCLDYFGMGSPEETQRGMPLHGEAGCSNWRWVKNKRKSAENRVRQEVCLSAAGLDFSREIKFYKNESAVLIRETATNWADTDHYFHWVQHATLGIPFLDPECSRIFLSGNKAKSWPFGYESKSLLTSDQEFRWPCAPREKGGETDLSIPFSESGTGFVASGFVG